MLTSLAPPPTLVESAYNNIKADIASSYLAPDEKINLKLLSSRYQVSETPIKQALNRLVSEGLVVTIPRKGMKVRRITAKEVEDSFDIRLMMDTFFVDSIIDAVCSDPALQSRMQEVIHKQIALIRQTTTAVDYDTVYRLDYHFHELYISASRNEKALEVYQLLNPHVYSVYIYSRQSHERTLDGALEHQAILDAILEKNEKKVRDNIYSHIENAKNSVCPILRRIEEASGH